MCRLLVVSRSGYLQWRRRPPSARAQANARLDAQVAALHAASKGSYGRPRIVRGLCEQGLRVGPGAGPPQPAAAGTAAGLQAPLPSDDGLQPPPAGGAERPRAPVRRLGPISWRGNVYLRTPLIQGARSTLQAVINAEPSRANRLQRWIIELHGRKAYHKTLIAIANKHARILCAMLAKNERYDAAARQRNPMNQPSLAGNA